MQLEAENTVLTESDCTGHAELNLIRLACVSIDRDALVAATLYTSTVVGVPRFERGTS